MPLRINARVLSRMVCWYGRRISMASPISIDRTWDQGRVSWPPLKSSSLSELEFVRQCRVETLVYAIWQRNLGCLIQWRAQLHGLLGKHQWHTELEKCGISLVVSNVGIYWTILVFKNYLSIFLICRRRLRIYCASWIIFNNSFDNVVRCAILEKFR